MGFLSDNDWNKDKNELTWKLFTAGYTVDDYPEGVKWDASHYEFEYDPKFICKTVLESPCGLLMKGDFWSGYMSYMGVDWRDENNNSVHRCPFNKVNCPLNHEYLRKAIGHKHDIVQCAFRFSNNVYDYENSYEKAWDVFYAMQTRKKAEFYDKLKWNPDEQHCYCIEWDDLKQEWYARYNPEDCAHGCYVRDICVLTGRRLDGKKGNVFYDVKITRVRHDGTFWDGETMVSIIKGKKMFDSPKPLAICDAYAKLCKDHILDREKSRFHRELFFFKDMTVEVLNVRAEYRESRDLLQDLRDVAEGIIVTHASDEQKKSAQAKRERRKKYREDKIRRREKRNIAKWERLLKDDEFVKEYAYVNGTKIEFERQLAERELAKRGIVVKKELDQLSLL